MEPVPESKPPSSPSDTTSKPRLNYSVDVKLRAIEFAETYGNRATQRVLGMPASNVRRWRKSKKRLEQLPPNRSTLRYGAVKHPGLDRKLKEWIREQQQKGVPVTCTSLHFKALAFAQQSSLSFRPSSSWAYGFLRRCGLPVRKSTKVNPPSSTDRPSSPESTTNSDVLVSDAPDNVHTTPNESAAPATNSSIPEVTTSISPQPSLSNLNGVGDTSSSRSDLLNKFRQCEARIFGTSISAVQGVRVLCEFCGKRFHFAGGDSSIRVCGGCREAVRTVQQQAQPVQERLGALEATVTSLKAQLDQLTTNARISTASLISVQREDTADPDKLRMAELLRENAELKSRLLRYEQAETRRRDSESSVPNGNNPIATSNRDNNRKSQRHRSISPSKTTRRDSRILKPVSPPPLIHSSRFACPACGVSLRTRQQLRQHVKSEHPASSNSGSGRKQCKRCGRNFTNSGNLKCHERRCIAVVATTADDDDQHHSEAECEVNVPNDADTSQTLFQCRLCSETFVQSGSLLTHTRQYHPDAGRCRGCGKRINHTGNLRRHESKCLGESGGQMASQAEFEVDEDDGSMSIGIEAGGDIENGEAEADSMDSMEQFDQFVEPELPEITIKLESVDDSSIQFD